MNDKTTEQLLPSFEPSEKDLVNMALAQPLEDKIRRSIGLLRHYEDAAKRLSPDGYYLAFSGGKDSCVIKQLAIEAGVKFKAWYNLTTIDPPELVRFIKRHHAEVSWNKPKIPMMQRMIMSGKPPPTRMVRWCCSEYKESSGGEGIRVVGVRVSESSKRMRLWKEFMPPYKKSPLLAPIVYWTDKDVWDFISSRNLPYCELYDQGFKRLGCIGCPLNPAAQEIEFNKWPRYKRLWKISIFKLWEKWHDIPRNDGGERKLFSKFSSGEEMWSWWIQEVKSVKGEAQCFQEEMDMNT